MTRRTVGHVLAVDAVRLVHAEDRLEAGALLREGIDQNERADAGNAADNRGTSGSGRKHATAALLPYQP